MAEIKVVPEPQPDPKTGKPKTRSGTVSPYHDLASCEKVAGVIHNQAGGSCDRSRLAALLKYSGTKNGSFLTRVASAKSYGLIDQEGEQLRITQRGSVVAAPVAENDLHRARLDAFMGVELFRKVFEEFNGQTLPTLAGLRNLFLNKYQLLPDRVDPAIKVMLESADTAGLFKASNGNRNRMVAPILGPATQQAATPPDGANGQQSGGRSTTKKNGNGGSNGGDDGIHPAILGLLRELPAPGPISEKKRTSLIAAFTAVINYIYPSNEDA